jgi:hypothetical protein
MSRPEPRPALQRSDDGGVHPATPRVAPEQHLHPIPHAPAAATYTPDLSASPAPTTLASHFTGKSVTLTVEVPKDLRKAVRRRADRESVSVDTVVAEALARYVTSQ